MGLYNRDYMRDLGGSSRNLRGRGPWSVVVVIMALCVAGFAAQQVMSWRGFGIDGHPALLGEVSWTALVRGEWWRLVTYNFVHDGPIHLGLNLVGLWFVGRLAWQEFGNRHWLWIFLLGGAGGAMAYMVIFHQPNQVLVGASAGIYALLAALTIRMPDLPMGFPFLPGLTVRLRNVTLGVLLFELISGIAQAVAEWHPDATVLPATHDQVASLAHLGGALTGFCYVKLLTEGFNAMVRESEWRERLWRDERQQRRERSRVVAGRVSAAEESVDPPVVDFMEEKVNPILEKLHAHGPASLSTDEQRILDEAARRLRGKL